MNEESFHGRPDQPESRGLPPKRAFWEALAVVAIPSVAIWIMIVFWVVRPEYPAEAWLLVGILAFIPIPLLVPFVYRRYRSGIPYVPSPGRRIVSAIILLCCSTGLIAEEWLGKKHNNRYWLLAAVFMILALINPLIALNKSSVPTSQ